LKSPIKNTKNFKQTNRPRERYIWWIGGKKKPKKNQEDQQQKKRFYFTDPVYATKRIGKKTQISREEERVKRGTKN